MASIQRFFTKRCLHLAYISQLIFKKQVLMAINDDDGSLVEDSLVNLQAISHVVSNFQLIVNCCNSS